MTMSSPREKAIRCVSSCELAFSYAGIPVTWSGGAASEKGISSDGASCVEIDPSTTGQLRLTRSWRRAKAREKLVGAQVEFRQLVCMKVEADLALQPGSGALRARIKLG